MVEKKFIEMFPEKIEHKVKKTTQLKLSLTTITEQSEKLRNKKSFRKEIKRF